MKETTNDLLDQLSNLAFYCFSLSFFLRPDFTILTRFVRETVADNSMPAGGVAKVE